MNLAELSRAYKAQREILDDLALSARYHFQRNIQRKLVRVHALTHRVKELDSLWEKARKQGVKDPLRDIRDLVGLRVVCLFRSDIPNVLGIVRESFDVIEEENKEDRNKRQTFDYMAVHIIAQMKPGNVGPGSFAHPPIPFEIQVRTIGRDTWASVSHHLHYKHETSFPPERLRDLYALSALFYLADVHFESLKAACTPSLDANGTQAP